MSFKHAWEGDYESHKFELSNEGPSVQAAHWDARAWLPSSVLGSPPRSLIHWAPPQLDGTKGEEKVLDSHRASTLSHNEIPEGKPPQAAWLDFSEIQMQMMCKTMLFETRN